jgi:hypothetical protein
VNVKPDSDGLIRRMRSEILSIAVSPKNLSRAFNIMNTLLKELEQRGFQIKIEMNYHGRNETFAVSDGQKIQIELRETLKMNKVKIDCEKYPWRQSDYERVFAPTGELRFEIKNVYGGNVKKIFKDGTNKLVEDQLNNIIINMYKSINYLNLRGQEWERERKIQEEKEKERNLILQRQKQEGEKTKYLLQLAKRWNKANVVRNFVKELEKTLIEENALTGERKNWIQWALVNADKIDPIMKIDNLKL